MAAPEPTQGDTVLIIDRTSSNCGKIGTVSQVRTMQPSFGVTFGDNVLRYFSREQFSAEDTTDSVPDIAPLVATLSTLFIRMEPMESGALLGTLTVRGNVEVLLALAAELVKRG